MKILYLLFIAIVWTTNFSLAQKISDPVDEAWVRLSNSSIERAILLEEFYLKLEEDTARPGENWQQLHQYKIDLCRLAEMKETLSPGYVDRFARVNTNLDKPADMLAELLSSADNSPDSALNVKLRERVQYVLKAVDDNIHAYNVLCAVLNKPSFYYPIIVEQGTQEKPCP